MSLSKILHPLLSTGSTQGDRKHSDMTEKLEHSGPVVECLTQYRRTTGAILTGVTALCP